MVSTWIRTHGRLLSAGLLLCLAVSVGPAARAQAATTPAQTANVLPGGTGAQISADSAPYHIECNGTTGVFIRHAFGQEPEQTLPLTFLHADAGPAGYAQHQVWFLARGVDSFTLVWCYLNDSGHDFWCWLYRFPDNQLTTQQFVGDYRFTPPAEPVAPTPIPNYALRSTPNYTGPDFVYGNWTRRGGTLDRLDLRTAQAGTYLSASTEGGDTTHSQEPAAPAGSPVKTLTGLRVIPLHELHVAAQNGWRAGGWRELHALATDAAGDPYYLILYTNTARGFAIDLRQAQTYVADFGQKIQFTLDTGVFGSQDNTVDVAAPPSVQRYQRYEIMLDSTQKYADPYTDVVVDCDIRKPDGKRIVVPGYWDGGNTWRVRFAPPSVGTWSWHVRSNDLDINGREGVFECVSDRAEARGFLQINASSLYQRHFAYADGSSFLPTLLRDPVHFTPIVAPNRPGPRPAALSPQPPAAGASPSEPASFVAFQQRVDACVALGFNRFVGGYLLSKPDVAGQTQQNEGGVPFTGGDLDRLNPAYFQWMDRRMAYCNEKGIVPDLGVGWLDQRIFETYDEAQLRRLWRYVLARYASFDVCWNLFGSEDAPVPLDSESRAASFAALTRLYDPYHHPLTVLTPGPLTASAVSGKPNALQGPKTYRFGELPPDTGTKPPVGTPGAAQPVDASWEDVITLLGGSIDVLPVLQQFNKPIVVVERASPARQAGTQARPAVDTPAPVAMTADAARMQMWETRMQGDYWASAVSPAYQGMDALQSPEIQAAASCARFFRQTHFWRLEPHVEMLGQPANHGDVVHRRRAEPITQDTPGADAPLTPPTSADAPLIQVQPTSKPPTAPVYVLADRGWEYVLYFEQGGTVTVDLLEATGRIKTSWFNPRTGQLMPEVTVMGGAYLTFAAPDTNDWVLYINRR